tara:strand:+ start:478 stop:972 length:495 start_codon:yes stop_codon:yes gene_type:complete
MAINFPNNPSDGTVFSAEGKTWIFDGITWVNQLVLPIGSATTLGAYKVGSGLGVDPQTGILTVTDAPALAGISTSGSTAFNDLTVTNLNVTGTRYGELAGSESTVGSSGFLYNVISLPREINVTEHTEISPNMLDDITYVKHESVTINEDVDLTISDGDFIIFH